MSTLRRFITWIDTLDETSVWHDMPLRSRAIKVGAVILETVVVVGITVFLLSRQAHSPIPVYVGVGVGGFFIAFLVHIIVAPRHAARHALAFLAAIVVSMPILFIVFLIALGTH
jgi:hypothetical protein